MSIFQVDKLQIFWMAHNTQLGLASGMVRHAILGKRRSGSNDRTRFGAYVTCAVGSVT